MSTTRKILYGIMIACCSVGIVLFFGLAIKKRYSNIRQYEIAKKYIEEENYKEAISILQNIILYKDSADLLENANSGKLYQDAIDYESMNQYEEALNVLRQLDDYKDSAKRIEEVKYQYALSLYEEHQYEYARTLFSELGKYEESEWYLAKIDVFYFESAQKSLYDEACKLMANGEYSKAYESFSMLENYGDSTEKAEWCKEMELRLSLAHTISAGTRYTLGVTKEKKVVATGSNENGRCNVDAWENIISVSGYGYYTIGLKENGTVITTDADKWIYHFDTSGWDHIVDVDAGEQFIIGLKADGTVISDGRNIEGQRGVDSWKNVVDIATGCSFTVGLTKEGKLLYAGHINGQKLDYYNDTNTWQDVTKIVAGGGGLNNSYLGGGHIVGLKRDGTVIAVGDNAYGQCDVSQWKNIVSIAAGDWYTVGVDKDGYVYITGENKPGRKYIGDDFFQWEGIIDVAAGFGQTIGLKKDGTLIGMGYNQDGEINNLLLWPPILIIK